MRIWNRAAIVGLVCLSSVAAAGGQVSPTPMIVGPDSSNVLRVGTPVALRLSEELSTKHKALRVGQRFQLEVAEAVLVNGQIAIPAGSPATGEITEVKNKGMWGKSGHLTAQVLYLQVNGRQIRLNGTFDDKGTAGTAGVVGAVAFLPVAGFLVTGTSAQVPAGAPVKAFVGEDVPVAFTASAPMVVPVAAVVPANASSPLSGNK